MPPSTVYTGSRHHSPPLGIVAIVFTVLFCAGLYPVTYFGGQPSFPMPWAAPQTVTAFLQQRHSAALLCAFLHFGSAIPLGIFTAAAVSRLRFLGIRAAGIDIALFGGFATAILMMASSVCLWTMTMPGVAQDPALAEALHFLNFALGGPGYSVPLGLLMAGLSIPAYFRRLVPRWIVYLGLALAVCGELSWLAFEFRSALPLIPLTRFPGYVWLIAFGFALPARAPRAAAQEVQA
ncbi:MAG TPA: hypothetical protein VME86_11445 [Acidobacteriaceae bacterium]|nr:hypothetical protein [Acidobacteriaceae bacterium]HUB00580.1 hypothetical protein [Terracidiphilus sp.]